MRFFTLNLVMSLLGIFTSICPPESGATSLRGKHKLKNIDWYSVKVFSWHIIYDYLRLTHDHDPPCICNLFDPIFWRAWVVTSCAFSKIGEAMRSPGQDCTPSVAIIPAPQGQPQVVHAPIQLPPTKSRIAKKHNSLDPRDRRCFTNRARVLPR
jgi:hypothetical protein